MSAVAFFGHRSYSYLEYREKIEAIIVDLIENHEVTEFYNGFRGDFDRLCAEIVGKLKSLYPTIKNILVLSYHPRSEFVLPKFFDESVYLLEKPVLPKFAITYTNQCIVDEADFIISGVSLHSGGAWAACDYARRQQKKVINIFENYQLP